MARAVSIIGIQDDMAEEYEAGPLALGLRHFLVG